MEQWSPQHRAFIVETYFKNGESVIVTQRKFRLHFNVPRHGRIPSRNTIFLWVHNFRTTASATKKHGVSKRKVRTPENVEAVRNAVDQSPRQSAVRHAQALRLSDTTVRSSDRSFRDTMFLCCRSHGTEVVHPKKYRVS